MERAVKGAALYGVNDLLVRAFVVTAVNGAVEGAAVEGVLNRTGNGSGSRSAVNRRACFKDTAFKIVLNDTGVTGGIGSTVERTVKGAALYGVGNGRVGACVVTAVERTVKGCTFYGVFDLAANGFCG